MSQKKRAADAHAYSLPPIYFDRDADDHLESPQEATHLLLTCFRRIKNFVSRNILSVSLASACALAVLTGLVMQSWRKDPYPRLIILAIKLLGILYLRFLEGMQLPLIIAGLVLAVGTISRRTLYRIHIRLYVCQVIFSSLAVIVSVMLMVCIEPGSGTEYLQPVDKPVSFMVIVYLLLDIIRNLFPPNLFESLFYLYDVGFFRPVSNGTFGDTGFENTVRHYDNLLDSVEDANDVVIFSTSKELPTKWTAGYIAHASTNFLGITFATIIFSVYIRNMGRRARTLINLCEDIEVIMLEMIKIVNLISPVGIFSLLLAHILETDFYQIINFGPYIIVTVVSVFIHCFVTLPFIFILVTNINPIHYMFNQTHASLAAFCTNSELAAYPVNLDCVVNKNTVDSRVASIVLTLGAFFNKNGTVIVQCTSCLYMAQVMRVSLTISQIVMIGFVAILNTSGSDSMVYPEVSLIAVDLHPLTFKLIAVSSEFLKSFATACDAYTSAYAAAIVANLSRDDLLEEDRRIPL